MINNYFSSQHQYIVKHQGDDTVIPNSQILICNVKRDLWRSLRRVDILSYLPDTFDSTYEVRHYTEKNSSSDSCLDYNKGLVLCIPAVN